MKNIAKNLFVSGIFVLSINADCSKSIYACSEYDEIVKEYNKCRQVVINLMDLKDCQDEYSSCLKNIILSPENSDSCVCIDSFDALKKCDTQYEKCLYEEDYRRR